MIGCLSCSGAVLATIWNFMCYDWLLKLFWGCIGYYLDLSYDGCLSCSGAVLATGTNWKFLCYDWMLQLFWCCIGYYLEPLVL